MLYKVIQNYCYTVFRLLEICNQTQMWIEISWTQIYDYNLIHDGIIYSFIILVYGHEMQLSIIVDV